MTNAATANNKAFAGLGDILAGGFDAMLTSDASEQMVALADIEIAAQVREEFEDEQHSLADLGKSLHKQQVQAILLRPNRPGAAQPYLLVAGERRVRAARIEGLQELRARIKPMSDGEAEDAQFAENVHRKNLTQIEEAKRIQRDLDQLGSVEAVLTKHHKSRAWLSKIMALLHLPAEAKRLITENISADIEVINSVKTIANVNPKRAAVLVNDLKRTRGRENARELVGAVREEVKPTKKTGRPAGDGSIATPRDRRQEQPGQGGVFAPAKTARSTRPAHESPLAQAYISIFESGKQPKAVLESLGAADREAVESFLETFYEAGKQATNAGRTVIEGFRNGGFSSDGVGAFALVAYLHGGDGKAKFSPLDIFGCMKP